MIAGLSPRAILLPGFLMALAAGASQGPQAAAIAIDYPEEGSIFPPEITPPAFLWHDSGQGVTLWRIDVSVGAGPPAERCAGGLRSAALVSGPRSLNKNEDRKTRPSHGSLVTVRIRC